MKESKKLSFG